MERADCSGGAILRETMAGVRSVPGDSMERLAVEKVGEAGSGYDFFGKSADRISIKRPGFKVALDGWPASVR